METGNALGGFLRARRERTRPEELGFRPRGQRRTPGLRREEVALAAGISTDYYLRLEQGRDRTPSSQVLDALATALRLDPDETAYLHSLVHPPPRRPRGPRAERVPDGTRRLLRALPMPAFVQDRHMTVLAANRMAEALSPNLAAGVNRLAAAFLDPRERELYDDWERATAAAVAQLRAVAGPETDDPRLVELVGELSVKSARFCRLWARQDVVRRTGRRVLLHHPEVGDLELDRQKLVVTGTDDQVLVVYHAEPGTPSAQALDLLGSIAVSVTREAAAGPDPGRRDAATQE
ncbi:helix-turn-helix domain-containing protein [Streptomyces sp. NPDC050560]|uniref:helix-turn-helix domain-containing protein n=1 Tax=Streptomyces sp. NPDC050560 TaxID=3365630 RepID=UPI00378A7193